MVLLECLPCHFVSLYILCNKIGQKRKRMECDSMVGELSAVLEKAEERAAERELRMRKMELEMEAKMREYLYVRHV